MRYVTVIHHEWLYIGFNDLSTLLIPLSNTQWSAQVEVEERWKKVRKGNEVKCGELHSPFTCYPISLLWRQKLKMNECGCSARSESVSVSTNGMWRPSVLMVGCRCSRGEVVVGRTKEVFLMKCRG